MVMHRPPPTSAACLAALLLIGPITGLTYAALPEALGEARGLLEKGQASSAVAFLEDALTDTPADRCQALAVVLQGVIG